MNALVLKVRGKHDVIMLDRARDDHIADCFEIFCADGKLMKCLLSLLNRDFNETSSRNVYFGRIVRAVWCRRRIHAVSRDIPTLEVMAGAMQPETLPVLVPEIKGLRKSIFRRLFH